MTSRIGWSAEEIPRHRAKQLWTSNPEASLFQEGERIFSAIYWMFISSIQFSQLVMSDSLWPHGLQLARLPCPSPTPEVYSNSCPLSRWYHPTILSLSSPSHSTLNLSQHQGLFKWVSFSHQVAKVLEFQLQHQSFQRGERQNNDDFSMLLVSSKHLEKGMVSLLEYRAPNMMTKSLAV